MGIYIHRMKLDGRPHKALFTERDGKFALVEAMEGGAAEVQAMTKEGKQVE